MAQAIGMSDEVRELRARMKDFIDNVVFKAEPELERQSEHGFHPETGLPLELYEAAEGARRRHRPRRARARATSPAGARPGVMAELKAEAKRARALGARPSEGDRRRRAAVHGLRLPERDHRPLGVRPGRRRLGEHAGLDHARTSTPAPSSASAS